MHNNDDDDNKIRKHWLIFTSLNYLTFPFLLLIKMANESESIDITQLVLGFCIMSCLCLMGFLLIYHCAYKKYGNILLTFLLIVSPIRMVADIFQSLQESLDILSTILILLDSGIFLWWYALSLKLRKLNSKIRSQSMLSSESYSQALSILQNATTLDELDSDFGRLMRNLEKEGTLTVNAVFEAYKVKKEALLTQT